MRSVMSVIEKVISVVTVLLRDYPRSRTESKEDEHKTSYKSQPFSVDPYLIAYAIEEQKKEREGKEEESD